MINVGDEVMVVGKLDNRVREQLHTGAVYGTVDALLSEGRVSVILENCDLFVGELRDVVLRSDQE